MEQKKNTKRNTKVTRGGSSRPRVQSQPVYRPQMYEATFQPQPVYRPQMYESPPFSYTTQQPFPHFPKNFNPFEMRTPVNIPEDDSEDDQAFVPETQPYNEEDEDVEVQEVHEISKKSKKADKKNWTAEEEEALARSWIKISVDKEVGDRQTKSGFWSRVLKHFETLVPRTIRTKDQLNSKWNVMNPLVVAFNGYYHQAVRINQSGCNDLQIFERAATDFQKHYGKPFNHGKAWYIVRDQPKWAEQQPVQPSQESEGSSKKRKSSDSSNMPTPNNEDAFDCDLPNLNENPAPSRQSKGKKKANVESSSSVRETLASYTTKRENFMMAQLEAQRKKDEEFHNYVEGEVYNRDMKFVMEPHDNIPDPVFKEYVIGRKRELCAKYGWPCSL